MLFVRTGRSAFCATARCDRLAFRKTSSSLYLSFALLNSTLNQLRPSLREERKNVADASFMSEFVSEISVLCARRCAPALQTLPSDLHLVWIIALEVEGEKNHLGNPRLPSAKSTVNTPKHRTRAGFTEDSFIVFELQWHQKYVKGVYTNQFMLFLPSLLSLSQLHCAVYTC